MNNEVLYLIIPYFNFNNSIFSQKNLDLFISNYSKKDNLRIVICEGWYDSQLPDYSDKIYKHLKFKVKNIIWVKENLINLAIKQLPAEAEYIAWSDRDIYFLNPEWVEKSIELLKQKDIIQPWTEIIYTNINNELELIPRKTHFHFCSRSALYSKAVEGTAAEIPTGGCSTGQIWAINKKFYNKIGKINDIEIVGGADSNIAHFCVLQEEEYFGQLQRKTSPKTLKNWEEYKEKFKDVSYGYVNGAVVHYWHGHLENRNYSNRHDILIQGEYNPEEDVAYDENGVIYLTEKGKRFENKIKDYFTFRSADETMSPKCTSTPFFKAYEIRQVLIPRNLRGMHRKTIRKMTNE